MILDEPTSGLDPLMQREFFEILRERNEKGATFLSSHILSEFQRNCSRAGIIRDGRLIACDSVESLSNTNAKRILLEWLTANILKKTSHKIGKKRRKLKEASPLVLNSAQKIVSKL